MISECEQVYQILVSTASTCRCRQSYCCVKCLTVQRDADDDNIIRHYWAHLSDVSDSTFNVFQTRLHVCWISSFNVSEDYSER